LRLGNQCAKRLGSPNDSAKESLLTPSESPHPTSHAEHCLFLESFDHIHANINGDANGQALKTTGTGKDPEELIPMTSPVEDSTAGRPELPG